MSALRHLTRIPDILAPDEARVVCWLDGGWGVDCLLGEQTREHGDLDLVVGRDDVRRVRRHL